MYVIIVGGGRTGSSLARMLLAEGHEIKIVDTRADVMATLHKEFPHDAVYLGDGSAPAVMEAIGIQRAQVLAAVTTEDDVNLVVATLARFEFGVRRIIARINDPRNAWLFIPEMGVDVGLNQAEILAKLIAEEMSLGDMMTLLKLRRGEYSLVEEKLKPDAPAIGVRLKKLAIPADCAIAALFRDGRVIVPHDDLVFEAGDEVLAVTSNQSLQKIKQLFN